MASVAEPVPAFPHVPARQVLLSAVALWITYFVLITLRGLVVELGEFNELLWRRALVTMAGILITLLAWPLLRRFDGRSIGVRVAAALVIMLPAALALAVINQRAFASVEQRLLEKAMVEEQLRHEETPPAPAPSESAVPSAGATTSTASDPMDPVAVRIRHDLSGNVLVDVGDGLRTAPPRLARPPVPPVPPQPPGGVTPPAPPAPPAPPMLVERKSADGGSEIVAPGGVVIRRRADGLNEIRVGSTVVYADDEDTDSVVDDLREAERDAAEAREDAKREIAEARRSADAARHEAEETARRETLRALADAGLLPAALHRSPPQAEPAPVPRAAPAPVAPAARPAPASASARPPAPRPTHAAKARPTARSLEPVAGKPAAPAPAPGATPAPAAAVKPAAAPVETGVAAIRSTVEDEGLWKQLTDVALGRYFLLIAWAALYLALGNAEMVRAAERREGEAKRAAKSAELRSLRYQVNPHFLFNTLNSLSALVMVGRTEQAERMIQTISTFYRHSLAADPTGDVPLADEIALQRHYLEIEAVRFPDRLRTAFEVPADLESACVPGMILQPLVENSIKYAVSASTRPVTIRIAARLADDLLVLTVADDGPGSAAPSGSTGIGLGNVRSRLDARFGDAARVDSGPLPAGGYATVLTLPVIRNGC